jgi:lambda family phage portal protein
MAVPFASLPAKARAVARSAILKMVGGVERPKQRASGFSVGVPAQGYEGASMSHRLSPWIPNRAHINSILASEGPLLRARTRQLIANTPHGSNASETFVSYATGTGIKPSPLIDTPAYKKRVTQGFNDWTDESDADGLTDFYGQQSLVARALFDAGECFVRFRDRFPSDGLTVPLQLQLLEAEQLDPAYTTIAPNGNRIRSGIEFDPIGRKAAYWFWRQHPGDGTILIQNAERVRVPAEQVLHIFKPLRPGQIRGRPWLTAGMVKLYDWDQYNDAEMTRKKGAAMFMAFILQEMGEDIGATGLVDDDTEADATGTADVTLEPGMAHLLPKGHDVKFSEPADVGPNYEPFAYRNLLELCASMGLPYFSVTGDTSKANYSSMRSALLDLKRRMEQFQWETLIFQFCRPVYRRWLTTAILSGAVVLPGFAVNPKPYMRVKWITPRWDWVDPLKDAQAEKLMVDAGFKARSDVIEERGEDADDTDARIAADHERERKLGLAFPVGFSKTPDAPAGTDQAPTGSDQQSAGGGGSAANAA